METRCDGVTPPRGTVPVRIVAAACAAVCAVTVLVGVMMLDKATRVSNAQTAEESKLSFFLRPATVAPGGTYELYLDVPGALFSKETTVAVRDATSGVLSLSVRNDEGLTIQLGVTATQAAGELPLVLQVPMRDGTMRALTAVVRVAAPGEAGPKLKFTNLPADTRVVAEGGFVDLELAVEGDGPFVVEYGLRERPLWASRKWNAATREMAADCALAIDGAETESLGVALPNKVNIVDVVAIDRNGRETFQSLVVESRAPCTMDAVKETGLLEKLFGVGTAWASCTSTNPSFTFWQTSKRGYDQKRDEDGTSPLLFTQSTCQGTVCTGCASCGGGDAGLSDGIVDVPGAPGMVFGHSGELKTTVTDLRMDVPGLNFAIQRTYRSQIAYHSRLGRNWDMNIFARYVRLGTATGSTALATGDMHFYRGDGRRDKYTWTGGVNFTSPTGFYDKFTLNPTANSQTIRHKDGTRYVFSERQVGTNVVFGKLSRIYDRTGYNSLAFNYDTSGRLTQITSSTGIDVLLSYYAATGYLSKIYQQEEPTNDVEYEQTETSTQDAVLSKVQYAETTFYEREADGDLTQIITPPSTEFGRKTIGYEYHLIDYVPGAPDPATDPTCDVKYNLETVYDPRGIALGQFGAPDPIVSLEYYNDEFALATHDRVSVFETDPPQFSGDEPDSHVKLEFSYLHPPGANPTTTYTRRGVNSARPPQQVVLEKVEMEFDTTLSDRAGLVRKTVLDSTDNTVAEWLFQRNCDCNQPTRIEDPQGHVVWQDIDGYGNVVRRIVDDGDGNRDDDDLVSLYKYADPNYITLTSFGGLLEAAAPNVVTSVDQSIDLILAAKKTRITYDTKGNVTSFKPPAFQDAAEFGGTTHQAETVSTYYTIYAPTGNFGQLDTVDVKLDGVSLRKTKHEYYTTVGDAKLGLLWKVRQDPTGLNLTTIRNHDNKRDLVGITDPRGLTTTYTRTGDRLIAAIEPPGGNADEMVTFKHDGNNNQVYADRGGNVTGTHFATNTHFDRLDRQVRVVRDVSTTNGDVVETSTGYDGEGRVRHVSETGGRESYTQYLWQSDGANPPVWQWKTISWAKGAGIEVPYKTGETLADNAMRTLWSRTYVGVEAPGAPSGEKIDKGSKDGDEEYSMVWNVYDEYGRTRLVVTSPDVAETTERLVLPAETRFYATRLWYDSNGNQVAKERGEAVHTAVHSIADPLDEAEYTFSYGDVAAYDSLNRVIKSTVFQTYVPGGMVSETYVPGAGSTGPLEVVTQHLYEGRVAKNRKKLDVGYGETQFTYDAVGRLATVRFPDGISFATNAYDANGNITKFQSIEYDSVAHITKPHVTWAGYDAQNRINSAIIEGWNNPSRSEAIAQGTCTYDPRGNMNCVIGCDQSGNELVRHTMLYDGLDRQIETVYDAGEGGEGGHLNLHNWVIHDDVNRTMTRRTRKQADQPYQDTVYAYYPSLGAVRKITYPNDQAEDPDNEVFQHDIAGRLLMHATAASDPPVAWDQTYVHDLLGRLTQRSVGGAGAQEESVAAFQYDYRSRLTKASSRLGATQDPAWDSVVERDYNALFLEHETQQKFGQPSVVFTTTATYDAGGRRSALSYPRTANFGELRTLNYTHDTSDRIETIGRETMIARYHYAGPGPRVRRLELFYQSDNEIYKDVLYDHLFRPYETNYRYTAGDSLFMGYIEDWGTGQSVGSPVFGRTSFQRLPGQQARTYSYDAIGRLASVTMDGTPTALNYDLANNRVQKGAATYAQNASNEMATPSTGFEGFTYWHGNLKIKDRTGNTADQAFLHDKLNRLVGYDQAYTQPPADPVPDWLYYYDALGRRVLKKKADGSELHYFFYDYDRVVLEVIDRQVSGTEVREYVYGNGIDEVLNEYIYEGTVQRVFWPLVDSLGNVRDLADTDQSLVARIRMAYNYNADGNLLSETPGLGTTALTQDVLFQGRTLDRETAAAAGSVAGALYYYRARQYDPELGRFVERDPIGVWTDRINHGNAYGFVGDNPANGVDPTGKGVTRPGILAKYWHLVKMELWDDDWFLTGYDDLLATYHWGTSWICDDKGLRLDKNQTFGAWIKKTDEPDAKTLKVANGFKDFSQVDKFTAQYTYWGWGTWHEADEGDLELAGGCGGVLGAAALLGGAVAVASGPLGWVTIGVLVVVGGGAGAGAGCAAVSSQAPELTATYRVRYEFSCVKNTVNDKYKVTSRRLSHGDQDVQGSGDLYWKGNPSGKDTNW